MVRAVAEEGRDTGRDPEGMQMSWEEPVPAGPFKTLQVYSPKLGAGTGGAIGQGAGPPECEPSGEARAPPCSGPRPQEAREEAEQQGGGQRWGAPGASGPTALRPLWALPRRNVAQGSLAAGHGHQGRLYFLGEGLARVRTPP